MAGKKVDPLQLALQRQRKGLVLLVNLCREPERADLKNKCLTAAKAKEIYQGWIADFIENKLIAHIDNVLKEKGTLDGG